MNDIRIMLASAAATNTLATTVSNNDIRGLEGHAVCHIQTKSVNITDLKPANPLEDGAAERQVKARLAVSVADSENATCQLCHLGHKTQLGKDLGKVLEFSSTGKTPASCLELHHLCGTLALGGDKTVFTMEELCDALEEAKTRRCHACNTPGAFIQCCYGDCTRCYHLGCSMNATDVVVDVSVGQLYCPRHTVPDSDDSSGADVALRVTNRKQKNNASSKGTPGPKKRPVAVQRPRTDWQRRGADTWVKVVPPWWAEQKTVHFANKVFRELFQNRLEVDLLDERGALWKCEVMKEMRNDMRLQFTLMGQFQELWVHAGIMPGDVLTFEKLIPGSSHPAPIEASTAPHVIRMTRHAQGVGFEDLMAPRAKKTRLSSTATSTMNQVGRMVPRTGASHSQSMRSAKSRYASRTTPATDGVQGKIVIQETPWVFESEFVARKVMHPNNFAKTRCPMTEELVAKIAGGGILGVGRMMDKIDAEAHGHPPVSYQSTGHTCDIPREEPVQAILGPTFAVFDPALRRHFVFEAEINPLDSTRYISGSGFLAWMVEAAVKPEDSIQLEFTDGSSRCQMIQVSKVPSSATPANTAGLPRAPSSDCSSSTSMRTLAAAACYCHTHGTPGIKALLDLPSSEREI